MTTLTRVTLKDGKPIYDNKEVLLTTIQNIILKGRGEGGSVLMRTTDLKYKEYDRENNK